MDGQLRRDVRLLQAYAAVSSLALVFIAAAAFRQTAPERRKFDEIDVERINVVEKDGRVRLVIANSDRQAVTVVDGRQILPGRRRDAGLIFFNDAGDENGGLTYGGRMENGSPHASAGLSFDQFKQDETVTLSYSQDGTKRRAGLTVADRPEISIAGASRLNAATSDDERAAIRRQLVSEGVVGARQRVFAGKDDSGAAKLVLSDGDARPRLVLTVDRGGSSTIEFLDAAGNVTRRLQP